ncbi:ATP-grasp domain-containing protein [Thiococcus pfennigii]|uniref:ATP-grasp domain-containing protein n=1 Tax=Thiococcus pfennigii TaxID=1057 RepID=UPI00190635A0|nr:ATP-grasp domain-containing protein [Thiococcus pfennigii]MBK1700673.1 biotin carboxylase [Thiococcus pfennigii]MBK1730334.1 biotin carboxylase [Thiococcus pfennigii]
MARVWFNRTFSNVRALLELIRRGDSAGEHELLCSHTQPGFPGFLAAHEAFLEPVQLKGDDYIDYCLATCATRGIDHLWPGKEAERLAAERPRFAAAGVEVLNVAAPETLALLRDKDRFGKRMRGAAIPPPDYRAIHTAAEFEAAYAELRARHPVLCIKPAEGVNGTGFRVIDEGRNGVQILLQGALHAIHLAGLRQLLGEAGEFPPLLLMEYLDGPEYSVDAVGDGQRLIALVQREKGGAGTYGQRIVARPALEQAVAEMTAAFALRGLFNIQFREGRDGLRLLEINPRFSGGIGYGALAGVNLPFLALDGLIHGFAAGPPPAVAVGARLLEVANVCRIGDEVETADTSDRVPAAARHVWDGTLATLPP